MQSLMMILRRLPNRLVIRQRYLISDLVRLTDPLRI